MSEPSADIQKKHRPAVTSQAHAAALARVQASFQRPGLLHLLGARLHHAEVGMAEMHLPHTPEVQQHQGTFHGGAIAALADAVGGYAGLSVIADDMEVVAVEFKINFLANYSNGTLRAVGRVLKAGKRLIVTAVEITHIDETGQENICAVMQQTLAPVSKTY